MLDVSNHCFNQNLRVIYINTFLLRVETKNVTTSNGLVTETPWRMMGLEANLLKVLSTTLNFTYTMRESKSYGSQLPNQTWTGVTGILAKNESDVAISFLADTYARRKVIDYSTPYYFETLNFFIGRQSPGRNLVVLFLSPFDCQVWLLLLGFSLFLIVFLNLTTPIEVTDKLWSLFHILGSISNQSTKILVNRPSVSIITAFWLVSLTVVWIFYADALKASISVSNVNTIDSLAKLAHCFRQGKLSVGIFDDTFMEDFVKNAPPSETGDLYKKVAKSLPLDFARIPSLNENKLAIIAPGKAFKLLLKYFGNENFQINKIKEHIFHYNIAVGFRRNFPCKDNFNEVIEILRETGCLSKWDIELERYFNKGQIKREPEALYIHIGDLKSTFVLLFSGFSMALLIFMSSFLYKQCKLPIILTS